jgi:hypothetical protein
MPLHEAFEVAGQTPLSLAFSPPGSLPHFLISQQFNLDITGSPFLACLIIFGPYE